MRSHFADVVFVNKTYDRFDVFSERLNFIHGRVHQFVGTKNGTHFHPHGGKPAVDPLFPIFHGFIDYIRLLHADCNEYDTVAAEDIDDYIPYSYCNTYNVQGAGSMDYAMDFSILCDETGGGFVCVLKMRHDLRELTVLLLDFELWHKTYFFR